MRVLNWNLMHVIHVESVVQLKRRKQTVAREKLTATRHIAKLAPIGCRLEERMTNDAVIPHVPGPHRLFDLPSPGRPARWLFFLRAFLSRLPAFIAQDQPEIRHFKCPQHLFMGAEVE